MSCAAPFKKITLLHGRTRVPPMASLLVRSFSLLGCELKVPAIVAPFVLETSNLNQIQDSNLLDYQDGQ